MEYERPDFNALDKQMHELQIRLDNAKKDAKEYDRMRNQFINGIPRKGRKMETKKSLVGPVLLIIFGFILSGLLIGIPMWIAGIVMLIMRIAKRES